MIFQRTCPRWVLIAFCKTWSISLNKLDVFKGIPPGCCVSVSVMHKMALFQWDSSSNEYLLNFQSHEFLCPFPAQLHVTRMMLTSFRSQGYINHPARTLKPLEKIFEHSCLPHVIETCQDQSSSMGYQSKRCVMNTLLCDCNKIDHCIWILISFSSCRHQIWNVFHFYIYTIRVCWNFLGIFLTLVKNVTVLLSRIAHHNRLLTQHS